MGLFLDYILARRTDSLITEAVKGSGYSDEHAFAHTWNHMVKHGLSQNRDKMHAELEKAKTDSNHPLHFNNISSDGFKGKDKTNTSPEKYYSEMHHAANTIHDVANHPDFKKEVKNKTQSDVAGASRGKISDSWKKHGAGNATSKADINIGDKKISYKKVGGSQLMSAESAEAEATYHHAAAKMHHMGHIDDNQLHEIKTKSTKISQHLASMKGASREDQIKHRDAAQKLVDELHNKHPLLNSHLHHEAGSGHEKFGGAEGKATHILSSYNEKTGTAHIMTPDDYHHPASHMSKPRIALPKGDGRPGNLKIDIKDHK